jgi:hypothetical protein
MVTILPFLSADRYAADGSCVPHQGRRPPGDNSRYAARAEGVAIERNRCSASRSI